VFFVDLILVVYQQGTSFLVSAVDLMSVMAVTLELGIARGFKLDQVLSVLVLGLNEETLLAVDLVLARDILFVLILTLNH
jgi:hypothetical protein